MGKNQSASGLTNIIQYDNNGNVSFVSGSTTLMQISSSGQITTTGVISGSNALSSSYALNSGLLNGTGSVGFATTGSLLIISSSQQQISASQQQISSSLLALTASYNALSSSYTALSASYNTASSSFSTRITSDSSSLSSRTTQIENVYATTGSNTFTGTQNFSNTCTPNSFTGGASIYTAGGLRVTQDAYFSSSVYIKGNVTVFGTQSVSYISSSQLDIGTNIITVNTATPSVRYGGLSVFDSGSTGLTGSIFWDSELNRWIYVNASGSGGGATYGGGMFISGPRNSVGLGCEQGTTACMLLVGQGGDHLTSSMIYHSSTVTCVPNTLIGGSTISGTTIYGSTAVCSAVGKFTTCIDAGSGTFSNDITSTSSTGAFAVIAAGSSNTNAGSGRFVIYDTTNNRGWGLQQDASYKLNFWHYNGGWLSVANISGTGAATFNGQLCSITGVFGTKGGGSYGVLISDNDQSNVRLRFTNTGGGNTWDLIGGLNAANNNDFSIRDVTNCINALRIVPVSGEATFNSSVIASGFYAVAGNSARFYRGTNDYYWRIHNDASNNLNFGTYASSDTPYGTNPKMILTDNGNVGIGTCSPSDLLHIEKFQAGGMGMVIRNACGATSNTSMCSLISLQLVGAGQTGQLGVNLIAGKEGDYSSGGTRNAFFAIQTACGDNLYERLRITSAGYVGINVTSACKHLEVGGTIRTTVSPSVYYRDVSYLGDNYQFGSSETSDNVDFKICGGSTWSAGGNFRWWTQAGNATPIERMRINSTGNLLATGGRISNARCSGGWQEWVAKGLTLTNNSALALFCINAQYDNLIVELAAWVDQGAWSTVSYKYNVGYNAGSSYTAILGPASSICGITAGTGYNETWCWKNCSGSNINNSAISLRIFGMNTQNSVSNGGADLIISSYLTRIS